MGAPVHSEIIIMKAFIFATILAAATAIPIEDTEKVKAAKAEHAASHVDAEARLPVATAYIADLPEVSEARDAFRAVYDMYAAGEAKPVATAYIADTQEVSDARDAFRVVYDKYAAGDVAHPVAPIVTYTRAVAPVAYTAKAVAPVTVAASYWNNYYGAYPYTHTAYAGYPYAHTGYPYAHTAYAGYYGAYPYALSTVAVAPTKAV